MDPRPFSQAETKSGYAWNLIKSIIREARYLVWAKTVGRDAKLENPILMIGIPHSGTTIAMKLLSSHPDVVNASEKNTYWQPGDYLDPWADNVKTEEDATEEEVRRINMRL